MRITPEQLKKIIKEEVAKAINEAPEPEYDYLPAKFMMKSNSMIKKMSPEDQAEFAAWEKKNADIKAAHYAGSEEYMEKVYRPWEEAARAVPEDERRYLVPGWVPATAKQFQSSAWSGTSGNYKRDYDAEAKAGLIPPKPPRWDEGGKEYWAELKAKGEIK